MRARWLSLLVMFAALVAAVPAAAQSWSEFRSESGRFRVTAPATPEETVGEIATGPAAPGANHIFRAVVDNKVYLVGWSRYNPAFVFDDAAEQRANRDNLVKGIGATLLSSTPSQNSGLTGLEFEAQTATIFLRGRTFNKGQRPYMVAVVVPLAQRDAPEIDRFLDSFAIVE